MRFINSVIVSAGFCFFLSSPVMAEAYTVKKVSIFEVK